MSFLCGQHDPVANQYAAALLRAQPITAARIKLLRRAIMAYKSRYMREAWLQSVGYLRHRELWVIEKKQKRTTEPKR